MYELRDKETGEIIVSAQNAFLIREKLKDELKEHFNKVINNWENQIGKGKFDEKMIEGILIAYRSTLSELSHSKYF